MNHRVTEEERAAGTFSPEKLATIVHDIETIGFAVIEDMVSQESCELLTESVLEDVASVRASGELTPHEEATGHGHLQLGLRRYAPYVKADLVANPMIECVIAEALGPGAWLGFYNGNVNCPDSKYQKLHYDRPFSWKTREDAERAGQSWPPPATTLGCSVAIQEITEDNGATEIYPGTHHETEVATWKPGDRIENHPDVMDRWAPPGRMAIPVGGVCIRDPRMWHRGVPNPADKARAMMAVTYHAGICRHWRGLLLNDMALSDVARCEEDAALRVMDDGDLGDGRLVFHEDTREVLESSRNLHGVYRNVRFVKDPLKVDHLHDAHRLGGARIVEDTVAAA